MECLQARHYISLGLKLKTRRPFVIAVAIVESDEPFDVAWMLIANNVECVRCLQTLSLRILPTVRMFANSWFSVTWAKSCRGYVLFSLVLY